MNAITYEPIQLLLSQPVSTSGCPQVVTFGVPFAEGLISNGGDLSVVTSTGERLHTVVRATAFWPDHSVKWGLVKFLCGQIPAEAPDYFLVDDGVGNVETHTGVSVQHLDDAVIVSDGELSYHFRLDGDQLFPSVFSAEIEVWSADEFSVGLLDGDGHSLFVVKTATEVVQQNSLAALIEVRGVIEAGLPLPINVLFRFEITVEKVLSATVEIHNPNRAIHTDGIWDLGDANSFNFKEFSLLFNRLESDLLDIKPEAAVDSVKLDISEAATFFQASSGGENWDSPTHVNAEGLSCNQFSGYSLVLDSNTLMSGKRANPVVRIKREGQGCFVVKLKDFWQNFPKSLAFTKSKFSIGVFPVEHLDGYELQGGERKQHEISFSFTDDIDSLDWLDNPLTFNVDPNAITQAAVIGGPVGEGFEAYDRLIGVALSESKGFIAKREDQDEFGWRHFGDVVADHETLYHEADNIFVSHYNNQYDAIYGFARQYLLTSDVRWHQLMHDLARHVMDIDIYRTTEDRAEYNHGLFWHTDHYLQASTCSHRTYSKSHYAEDWTGNKGGGPGPEHCYTTGLKFYYHITGNEGARDAVLGLANWIRYYYEGTGTLIEGCKNLLSRDRHILISVLKGHQVFRYRYTFDRGMGNYIRALLDSYELTLDESYILETEAIIMNTFSSADDISLRNLDDVEFTWFYTVFLQEVIKYLDLKRTMGSLDSAFCYARNALLHYAHWMAINETPALNSAKPLEYANDTWIAQDIRKANILYAAYRYETENRDLLLARAKEFRDYVTGALAKSETLHFSRIQIILLQNHGPSALMDSAAEPYDGLIDLPKDTASERSCFFTKAGLLSFLLNNFWQVIRKFNLTREINWVRARFG